MTLLAALLLSVFTISLSGYLVRYLVFVPLLERMLRHQHSMAPAVMAFLTCTMISIVLMTFVRWIYGAALKEVAQSGTGGGRFRVVPMLLGLLLLPTIAVTASSLVSQTHPLAYIVLLAMQGVLLALASGFSLWMGRGLLVVTAWESPRTYPETPRSNLIWLTLHVCMCSMLGGLIACAFALSNLAQWTLHVSPEAASAYYLIGARLGAGAGLILTPASKGNRIAVTAAVLSEALIPGWWTPILQLILVAAVQVKRWGTGEAVRKGAGYTLGAAVGRILGRIVGFLFLGLEGTNILEPVGEEILGLQALRFARSGKDLARTSWLTFASGPAR